MKEKNRTLIDQIIGDVQYIDIIGFFRLQSLYYIWKTANTKRHGYKKKNKHRM